MILTLRREKMQVTALNAFKDYNLLNKHKFKDSLTTPTYTQR